ncbi:XdhC family protein [Falsigemmobacter faecalis]|uniref:XdhC family protein n=1 Tax=Falsigemmobacter faecalis TaxID=2488730 RepID=A0A3P3DSY6_9RHOB|nr:XdhC family protein [Falsigemmobacter faecalis]RRH77397.1 XdhC family protein [Falsigemmobacter faecalis]
MTATAPLTRICESDLPLAALRAALQRGEPAALAVITGVLGASYRPLGAGMVVTAGGQRFGNLSSGCIERDVEIHALAALADGQIRHLRYGQGSAWQDLQLPCGGGLDILLLPCPDARALEAAALALAARREADLTLGPLRLTLLPELRFLIFGKGPETRALAQMAHAAGYLSEVFSPDPETLEGLPEARLTPGSDWPEGVAIDPRTAVTLFFHDHDREPQLLARALSSEAFFIGAQGSARAAATRDEALRQAGIPEPALTRLARPFGLIPSVRDPRSLAISVLAQVLDRARSL